MDQLGSASPGRLSRFAGYRPTTQSVRKFVVRLRQWYVYMLTIISAQSDCEDCARPGTIVTIVSATTVSMVLELARASLQPSAPSSPLRVLLTSSHHDYCDTFYRRLHHPRRLIVGARWGCSSLVSAVRWFFYTCALDAERLVHLCLGLTMAGASFSEYSIWPISVARRVWRGRVWRTAAAQPRPLLLYPACLLPRLEYTCG